MVDVSAAATALRDVDVSNVFIYVGDAVRDDYLAHEFRQQGTYIRTIASSIHSPASFASIATGVYPPGHGVGSFSDRLPTDVREIFDIPGTNSRFLNSIFAYATEEHGEDVDPIYSVLDTDPPAVDSPFEGLDPPFIAMERGPGGHAPYGEFTGTVTEYFRARGADRERIRADYERSIELDVEWFEKRVRELADRDILEETLVIYTSDHGELLGEGGMLGHNDTMRPELVYVPTVFRHPDLPNLEVTETTFHHVDLLPTMLAALGQSLETDRFDGIAPADGFANGPRPCFWREKFHPEWVRGVSGELSYEGVWDDSGGRVRTETGFTDRFSVLLGKLITSSKRAYMWRHLDEGIDTYSWSSRCFGAPSFDDEAAKAVLERVKKKSRRGRKTELSPEEKEHLRNLGYLN